MNLMKLHGLMKHFIELMRCEVRIQTGEEYKDAFRCENSDFVVSDQRPFVPEFGEPDGDSPVPTGNLIHTLGFRG